mgnify:CR=1 FL=1
MTKKNIIKLIAKYIISGLVVWVSSDILFGTITLRPFLEGCTEPEPLILSDFILYLSLGGMLFITGCFSFAMYKNQVSDLVRKLYFFSFGLTVAITLIYIFKEIDYMNSPQQLMFYGEFIKPTMRRELTLSLFLLLLGTASLGRPTKLPTSRQ